MAASTFLEAGSHATQDFSLFSSTTASSGAVTSATDQFFHGSRSIKSNTTGTNGSAFASAAITALSKGVVSCRLRFSTGTPSSDSGCLSINNAGGSSRIEVGLTTGGKLTAFAMGAHQKTGTATLSGSKWYRLSVAWSITATNNWSATIRIYSDTDGTTLLDSLSYSNTDVNLADTNFDNIDFGINSAISFVSAIMSIWYSDLYVDARTDGSDTGDVRVTAKRPNANGTLNEFTTQIGSGGSGYGSGHSPQVNERPLSATNGWSLSLTTRKTEEYNIENQSTGDDDITGATLVNIMGWVRGQNNSASNSPVGRIIVDGTATSKSFTTSAATFTQISPNPQTYPAGTGTDIGMDGQYTTTPHVWSLYECGILIAYTPSAGGGGKGVIFPKRNLRFSRR